MTMTSRAVPTVLGKRGIQELYRIGYRGVFPAPPRASLPSRPCLRLPCVRSRGYASLQEHGRQSDLLPLSNSASNVSLGSSSSGPPSQTAAATTTTTTTPPPPPHSHSHQGPHRHGPVGHETTDWEDNPDLNISKFSELPSKDFGVNQHIVINEEFKEALRQILWQFRAPIRYAFAYGSGVFPQSSGSDSKPTLHPSPPEAIVNMQKGGQKMIDFIFAVSYSQHWHSLNLQEHRDHYSAVGSLGSYAVSKIQDSFGAGVYFNPYITVNGTLIKYGVVNIDTLCKDLSEWNTLYLAGRLHKPVKILRDNPSVRFANQVNLLSAVRAALLLLPAEFTEEDLYSTIAGISYMGDPRMHIGGDDPRKVANIVKHQLPNFRRLYTPLIDNMPNISFNDSQCSHPDWIDNPTINTKLSQNMDPRTRGHMVRRLPSAFREKLYFQYQAKFRIPRRDFNKMMEETRDDDPERIRKREGGPFDQRIAEDEEGGGLREEVRQVIKKTIQWPATTQSLKSVLTAGLSRSWRYAGEKRAKAKAGAAAQKLKQKSKEQ